MIRIADWYCGAGLVARGIARALTRAGLRFEIVGVDIEPQPRYPFRFVQADVLKLDAKRVRREFDFVWASPPCQGDSAMRHAHNAMPRPVLIKPTRRLVQATGLPYAIENVIGAALVHPVMLCGSHFNLGVEVGGTYYQLRRHRNFEASYVIRPKKCYHKPATVGVYGGHARCRAARHGGRGTRDFVGYSQGDIAAIAMGVVGEGLTLLEMSQGVPPAYADYVVSEWLRTR